MSMNAAVKLLGALAISIIVNVWYVQSVSPKKENDITIKERVGKLVNDYKITSAQFFNKYQDEKLNKSFDKLEKIVNGIINLATIFDESNLLGLVMQADYDQIRNLQLDLKRVKQELQPYTRPLFSKSNKGDKKQLESFLSNTQSLLLDIYKSLKLRRQ